MNLKNSEISKNNHLIFRLGIEKLSKYTISDFDVYGSRALLCLINDEEIIFSTYTINSLIPLVKTVKYQKVYINIISFILFF